MSAHILSARANKVGTTFHGFAVATVWIGVIGFVIWAAVFIEAAGVEQEIYNGSRYITTTEIPNEAWIAVLVMAGLIALYTIFSWAILELASIIAKYVGVKTNEFVQQGAR